MISCLFGGARLRSRTLKTLVVLGAVLALASITVGSASAAFPPTAFNGWYTHSPVGGTVEFDIDDPAHEFVGDITCTQSPDGPSTEVTFHGMVSSSEAQVSLSGETSPFGVRVKCEGTKYEQNRICLFGGCVYLPGFHAAGPVSSNESEPLRIDTSGPLVTAVAQTSPNANGWYNAPTTVTFSGSDPNSGIWLLLSGGGAFPYCDSGHPFGSGVAGESIGPPDGGGPAPNKEIHFGCMNGAGLISSDTLVYKYDGHKPTISAAATTLPNSNDWYNGNVDIKFTCHDNLSGVASCPANEILSSEGDPVVSTARTTTDNADNVSNPSNTVEVKIDKTAPTMTGPANKTVNATSPAGATVNLDVTADDSLSGISSLVCSPADGSVFPIGATTVTCTAIDKAGNTTTRTFIVQVNGAAAQLSALLAAVTSVAPGTAMADKVKQIQGYVASNDKASACSGLTEFISLVKAQAGKKKLTAAQATPLIDQANTIRATLGC